MRALLRAIQWFGGKRLAALILAPSFLALGFDAAVSHLADKPMADAFQLVPIALAPIGFLGLMTFALWPDSAIGRWISRIVGTLSLLVGLAGTGLHLKAFVFNMEGHEFTPTDLQSVLALSPPAFAPGAYLAIGLVVLALSVASVRIRIEQVEPMDPPGISRIGSRRAA